MNLHVRRLTDGNYFVPRDTQAIVAEMSKHFERIGRFIWRPRLQFDPSNTFYALAPLFHGKAYVMCKGKSVDGLSQKHFEPGVPVLCTNEAVMLAEKLGLDNPIIGVRQDGKNRYYFPQKATMIVKVDIMSYYSHYPNTIPWIYERDSKTACTLGVILMIVKALGVTDVTIYGADAQTTRSLEYSDCADKADKARPNKALLKQHSRLKELAVGMNCKWIHPDLENFQMEL